MALTGLRLRLVNHLLLHISGMMIRPKGDQLEITFSVSDTESWDGFVQNLNNFLSRKKRHMLRINVVFFMNAVCLLSGLTLCCLPAAYNDSYQVQTNDDCPPDQYFIQEDSGTVTAAVSLRPSLRAGLTLFLSHCRSGTSRSVPVSSIGPCCRSVLGCRILSMVTAADSPASSSNSTGYR